MAYPHWTMFEVIDEDLYEFSRQVEFEQPNFRTYSVALVRLYLSIGSEIDVVAKLLCQRDGVDPKAESIDQYRKSLQPKYPHLATLTIFLRPIPERDKGLTPWDAWNNTPPANPTWWTVHNKVKHERGGWSPCITYLLLQARASKRLFATQISDFSARSSVR